MQRSSFETPSDWIRALWIAYYQLAQADLARHDWVAAYGALEKTIELNPTRLDARLNRGRIDLAARQFRDAEEEANFILKQDATNVGLSTPRRSTNRGNKNPMERWPHLRKLPNCFRRAPVPM